MLLPRAVLHPAGGCVQVTIIEASTLWILFLNDVYRFMRGVKPISLLCELHEPPPGMLGDILVRSGEPNGVVRPLNLVMKDRVLSLIL